MKRGAISLSSWYAKKGLIVRLNDVLCCFALVFSVEKQAVRSVENRRDHKITFDNATDGRSLILKVIGRICESLSRIMYVSFAYADALTINGKSIISGTRCLFFFS